MMVFWPLYSSLNSNSLPSPSNTFSFSAAVNLAVISSLEGEEMGSSGAVAIINE